MIYTFDGTYVGFLCCVFACFEYKDAGVYLCVGGDDRVEQGALFETNSRRILSDPVKAQRVQAGLKTRLGPGKTMDFFRVFLSEDQRARAAAFGIICRVFSGEQGMLGNYGDDEVLYFQQTLRKVSRERHRMKAFVRFSKSSDGLFFAEVEPDFDVLPLIVDFFRKRYADQRWLIYDVRRRYGMLYDLTRVMEVALTPEEQQALSADTVITLDAKDAHFQGLWKQYYDSTTIQARRNMKLHLQHVPRRYWKYLVEKHDKVEKIDVADR